MRGRLGSGILSRLSLPELIADNLDAYVDIAVGLAGSGAGRPELRDEIRRRLPRIYRDHSSVEDLQDLLLSV
jgi:predicted O-linked N-acetylglucosamine transferase (SPINDLY family)